MRKEINEKPIIITPNAIIPKNSKDKKLIDLCLLCGKEAKDECRNNHKEEIKEVWLSNILTTEEMNIINVRDLWEREWENARAFFKSDGNIKTRSRLKANWQKDFYKILEEVSGLEIKKGE